MNRSQLNEIMKQVEERIHALGFSCLDVHWVTSGSPTLRIFIDLVTADGDRAVSIDDCERVSRLLNDWQELDDLIEQPYQLEISSPGVERPLRKAEHFAAQVGKDQPIKVKLYDLIENRRNGTGLVTDVNTKENVVTLSTELGPWTFPLDKLKQASLVYDWKR